MTPCPGYREALKDHIPGLYAPKARWRAILRASPWLPEYNSFVVDHMLYTYYSGFDRVMICATRPSPFMQRIQSEL